MLDNNIALYLRLSEADRNKKNSEESNSIIAQRLYLNNYLDNKEELRYFNRVEYIDDGYSGTNDNRPEFKRMLEDIKTGYIKTICIKDMSRFFRNYIISGYYLEKEFPLLGVRVISLNDNYDSSNFIGTTGSMEMVIRNIVYSAYSKDLSMKVKSVKKQMMKEGKFTGGLPPYGYIRNPENKHKLIIDKEVSHNVERIFNLLLQGYKVSEIANIFNVENIETPKIYRNKLYCIKNKDFTNLNIWKYDSIHRILTNEIYIGNMVNGKGLKNDLVVVPNTHKGIINKEEFQKAQNIINKNKNKNKNKPYEYEMYPLKSLLQCGKCGRLLWRKKRKSISNFYICGHCGSFSEVEKISVNENALEKIIFKIISHYIQMAKPVNIKKDYSINYSINENKINTLEMEKFNLYKKYSKGIITKDNYICKKQRINKNINMYKSEILEGENTRDYKENILTYNMAHSFIEKILVYDEEKFQIIMKYKDIFK